jgi:prevent-host-death family protein
MIMAATRSWSLQDAKAKFSAVVAAAERGAPQLVTKRGRPAVVVVAAEAYDTLRGRSREKPRKYVERLLEMPKGELPEVRLPWKTRRIRL